MTVTRKAHFDSRIITHRAIVADTLRRRVWAMYALDGRTPKAALDAAQPILEQAARIESEIARAVECSVRNHLGQVVPAWMLPDGMVTQNVGFCVAEWNDNRLPVPDNTPVTCEACGALLANQMQADAHFAYHCEYREDRE